MSAYSAVQCRTVIFGMANRDMNMLSMEGFCLLLRAIYKNIAMVLVLGGVRLVTVV